MALAFHGGGNGGIVGIDDVARTQALALGQMPRLFGNLVMSLAGLAQVTGKAFTRRGTHLEGLLEMLLGVGMERL